VAWLRHSQMLKCSRNECQREVPKRCVRGLCGSCCQPTYSQDAHFQSGNARGRPGRPKTERWRNAWKSSIDFVDDCLAHPGAFKFMESERFERSEVFDAVFKMMKQSMRDTTSSTAVEPRNPPLHDQLATLSSIIHPADIQRAIALMHQIPGDLVSESIPTCVGEEDIQSTAQGMSTSPSGIAVISSASSSHQVMRGFEQLRIGSDSATNVVPIVFRSFDCGVAKTHH
jgi:hypothetical protein